MKKIIAILAIAPVALWTLSYMLSPSPDKISEGGELIVKTAIPWWIQVIQFFAPLGIIGAIVIIVILIVVNRQN